MESWLVGFLAQMVYGSPILIVVSVGIVLAFVRWRRHPLASLYFAVALGLFLVLNTVGTLVLYWLPSFLIDGQWLPSSQAPPGMPIIYFVRNGIGAVGWVFGYSGSLLQSIGDALRASPQYLGLAYLIWCGRRPKADEEWNKASAGQAVTQTQTEHTQGRQDQGRGKQPTFLSNST